MVYRATNDSIIISKKAIRRSGGVVVLSLQEYRKLRESTTPNYYLTGKEAEELDKLVESGLREYRSGKTIKAASLREALKIYGRKQNRKY